MVSVKEKMAYGLGDTASNLIFQTVMLFLAFYYTDIVGLSPTAVGIMFLAVRAIDAITDPLMGAFADKTKTKWGAYRPYLLWLALPFAVSSILAFTVPDFGDTGKLVCGTATYILLMLMYTAINIPYSALGGVITEDVSERVSVQSYRFVFAMIGGLIVSGLTLPMVEFFGQGDQAKGYQYAMITMSLFGMLLFILCFLGTKERARPATNENRGFQKTMKAVWANDQASILCVAAVILLTGLVLRGGMTIYYVREFLGMPDKVTLVITLGTLGGLIGAALAFPLSKKVCKVKAYVSIQIVGFVLCIVNYFVPAEAFIMAIVLHVAWSLVLQMASPILWAMIADTIDYGEWRSGERMTGVTYSTVIFFIKVGVAIGGFLTGTLLGYYGYVANEVTPEAQSGIAFIFTIVPGICFLLVAVVMMKYTLTASKLKQVNDELQATVK